MAASDQPAHAPIDLPAYSLRLALLVDQSYEASFDDRTVVLDELFTSVNRLNAISMLDLSLEYEYSEARVVFESDDDFSSSHAPIGFSAGWLSQSELLLLPHAVAVGPGDAPQKGSPSLSARVFLLRPASRPLELGALLDISPLNPSLHKNACAAVF